MNDENDRLLCRISQQRCDSYSRAASVWNHITYDERVLLFGDLSTKESRDAAFKLAGDQFESSKAQTEELRNKLIYLARMIESFARSEARSQVSFPGLKS